MSKRIKVEFEFNIGDLTDSNKAIEELRDAICSVDKIESYLINKIRYIYQIEFGIVYNWLGKDGLFLHSGENVNFVTVESYLTGDPEALRIDRIVRPGDNDGVIFASPMNGLCSSPLFVSESFEDYMATHGKTFPKSDVEYVEYSTLFNGDKFKTIPSSEIIYEKVVISDKYLAISEELSVMEMSGDDKVVKV